LRFILDPGAKGGDMRDPPLHQFFHISHFGFIQIYRSRFYRIEVELDQTFPSRRRRRRGFPSLLALASLSIGIGSQR
jgi:hypothetical protein